MLFYYTYILKQILKEVEMKKSKKILALICTMILIVSMNINYASASCIYHYYTTGETTIEDVTYSQHYVNGYGWCYVATKHYAQRISCRDCSYYYYISAYQVSDHTFTGCR